jgi:hypothetical protein
MIGADRVFHKPFGNILAKLVMHNHSESDCSTSIKAFELGTQMTDELPERCGVFLSHSDYLPRGYCVTTRTLKFYLTV